MIGLLMLAAVGTNSYYVNGNALLTFCQDDLAGACTLYIEGAADTYESLQSGNAIKRVMCVPQEVTGRQIKDIVIKYLGAHPETRHKEAAGQIGSALIDAFPCPKL